MGLLLLLVNHILSGIYVIAEKMKMAISIITL